MANTGNIFPGTGENNTGIGATGWTGPGNIVSDNTTDATCNAAASSQYLVARNFGLSIPAGATINGILVRIEASEHSGGTEALLARLQDASGALFGTGKNTANEGAINGTTKAVYTYGSTSDVWGAALTPAIVNDPDFGVRFWFTTAHDVRADFVTIAVEYSEPVSVAPGTGDLLLTGFAPTVTVTNNVTISPGTGELLLVGFAPTVAVTANQVVTPGTGELTLEGFAPTVQTPVNVTPGVGELVLEGFAPTVAVSDNKNVTPGTGALILTGHAPTVEVSTGSSINVTPGTAELILEGFAPIVLTPVNITPGTGGLILEGFGPIVSVSNNQVVEPGTGLLLLEGFEPTIDVGGGSVEVLPGTGEMVLEGFAPTVSTAVVPPVTLNLNSEIVRQCRLTSRIIRRINLNSRIT